MNPLEKRWQIAPPITPQAEENLQNYPPVLRQILFNRGYATREAAEAYFGKAPGEEPPPEQLLGLSESVERLVHAIKTGETTVVYGDYDTDGVTATALIAQTLTALGGRVRTYIPNRFDEGYGLNIGALEQLKAGGADLLLTVDCGIRALEQAEHARNIGLDLIITDHHTPGTELPVATAIINAKQPGDPYPSKNLAGVGIAYKLASALIERLQPSSFSKEQLLDLVAIGTVADLVPLNGENRILVRKGLHQLRNPHRQGLASLMGVSGVRPGGIQASDIGFVLGPRLNAAGRLGSAQDALRLLLATDLFEAGQLAQQLDNRNRQRQKITQEVVERSEEIALAHEPEVPLLFAVDPSFNPGVLGLAAARLLERYYRPAIVAHRGDQFTRASCRSINEFHITEALEANQDLLDHYGGHAAAAGFTVKNSNLPTLIDRLKNIATQQLGNLELRPSIYVDVEIPLADLKAELLNQLSWLEPTGYGNPEATFVTRNVRVESCRAVGREKHHLKLTVSDGWVTFDAIAFRLGHWYENIPPVVDLLYTFELNEFNGRQSLQLNVKDIKPGHW